MNARGRARIAAPVGVGVAVLVGALGCRSSGDDGGSASKAQPSAVFASSIGPPPPAPPLREGMVWIPSGALVAGTPRDRLPRIADAEMPGEQVVLDGYHIDVFPYPNEEGAIPLTGVTREEAAAMCAARDKRLCSELEWERACKGPDNRVYEYGDRYRPDRCGTGTEPGLRPSGLRVACRSDFGVRDLHGGAFEWTSSPWGRGTGDRLATIRGGNGTAGEVVGRCAFGRGVPPDTQSRTIGFRCCAGPRNTDEVVLPVRRGRHLESIGRPQKDAAARVLELLPDEARAELRPAGAPGVLRSWVWRPVGNEELFLTSVCAGPDRNPTCGVLVAREDLGRSTFVAWASSGRTYPSLKMEGDPRDVWLLGFDRQGTYKRLISYAWGRVTVHGIDRRVGKKRK
ncbi:MAG TPA: SUMF1/EgtB/PvdO family nonheme iron enzyme [Polyangiaceae bacterium]|nr:SUMF1/EgtB/PvdO family nonheme iron enzyme [Polyangiaceae bacterium]